MQTVELQNVVNQTVATSQSDSTVTTSDQTDIIPTVRNDDNSKNNSSILALFVSMFAFIAAFANFFYQSYGESHSSSIVNSAGVTITTYSPKSYIIAGTGYTIDGLTLSFLAGIFAFVVAMVALIVILRYSKIIK